MKKLLLIPALLAGSLALAQQHKFEISPMIGYDFAEGNFGVENNGYPVGGLEIQFNTPDSKISPEFSLLYSDGVDYDNGSSIAGQDTRVVRVAFNGVYTFDTMDMFQPFAKLGAGFEAVKNPSNELDDGFFLDAGAGAKIPFTDHLALKMEAIYMAKLRTNNTGMADSNLITMVGLTFSFGGDNTKSAPASQPTPEPVVEEAEPVVAPVVVAVVEKDDDKDGVLNKADSCPNTLKGIKVDAKGCNVDTDNDGVLNAADACPNTLENIAVDAKGCNADTDNDGVLNEKDLCANTPLDTEVNSDGCPKIITLDVTFKTNSAEIKEESLPQMQKYSAFLNKNKNYSAKIVGYTDSRGSASYNKKLSQKRADAVAKYLVNNGVESSRVIAKGAGEVDPIATNDTAEGRAKNRRIEAELTRN